MHSIVKLSIVAVMAASVFAQQPGRGPAGAGAGAGERSARVTRPALFLREEWKQIPAGGEHPVTMEATANENLELKLYGSGKEIQLTGSAGNESDPIHLWTGLCTNLCGATLRDKNNFADLTGLARIKWLTKVSGFHRVHPIVKLADGTWLVGDRADGSTADWLLSEFAVSEIRWLRLDIEKLLPKGNYLDKVDLSKVDEIGFADLMPGSGHGPGGWIDVATIEVYAKPVKR